MRILYLDCGMGAAGDMLTASLLQLFSEPVKQVKKLNDLKIPGVKISVGGVYKRRNQRISGPRVCERTGRRESSYADGRADRT